ncbi:MAG: NUDIX hydrolase N-terminal domain-containing protein [Candidatus Binataceae bacterium]
MPQSDLVLETARFVERVAAIAKTGLAFKPDGYDTERYEELLREAAQMRARLSGAGEDEARALERRWRAEVVSGYDGYVTTAVGCGVIAFNDRDELLMLQRINNRWWYPTGFCDVGISPAENAAKEAREETGLVVRPLALMAVMDSLKLGSPARHIYSMLFYCRIEGGTLKPNPLEAHDAGFYPLDRLPEPMHGRDRRWIALARQFHLEGRREPYFDPA